MLLHVRTTGEITMHRDRMLFLMLVFLVCMGIGHYALAVGFILVASFTIVAILALTMPEFVLVSYLAHSDKGGAYGRRRLTQFMIIAILGFCCGVILPWS